MLTDKIAPHGMPTQLNCSPIITPRRARRGQKQKQEQERGRRGRKERLTRAQVEWAARRLPPLHIGLCVMHPLAEFSAGHAPADVFCPLFESLQADSVAASSAVCVCSHRVCVDADTQTALRRAVDATDQTLVDLCALLVRSPLSPDEVQSPLRAPQRQRWRLSCLPHTLSLHARVGLTPGCSSISVCLNLHRSPVTICMRYGRPSAPRQVQHVLQPGGATIIRQLSRCAYGGAPLPVLIWTTAAAHSPTCRCSCLLLRFSQTQSKRRAHSKPSGTGRTAQTADTRRTA